MDPESEMERSSWSQQDIVESAEHLNSPVSVVLPSQRADLDGASLDGAPRDTSPGQVMFPHPTSITTLVIGDTCKYTGMYGGTSSGSTGGSGADPAHAAGHTGLEISHIGVLLRPLGATIHGASWSQDSELLRAWDRIDLRGSGFIDMVTREDSSGVSLRPAVVDA